MMRIFRYIVPVLLFLPACQRQEEPVTPVQPDPSEPELVEVTLYASTPGEEEPASKTTLDPDDPDYKKILWSNQEFISILSGGNNYDFRGTNTSPASSTSFVGTAPANLGNYIALYPYDIAATYDGTYVSTTLPYRQSGLDGSFDNGCLLTADDATGDNISFNHVCSGLRFKVNSANIKSVSIRGNNGEKIAGSFRFRFDSPDTPVAEAGSEDCVTLTAPVDYFEKGKYYYIVILPTVFSHGFTLTADNNGTQIGELRFDSSVTFSAGKFKTIKNSTTEFLDERMTWSPPKSQVYYGPQNSFCLRPSESITVDVNPRKIYGSWLRSGLLATGVEIPNSIEVLWGNSSISSAEVVGSSVKKMTITASSTPGSALVALKKGETILWSYLIWVTESPPAETTLPGGAVIQSTLGGNCYFQWGRKDPLVDDCPVISHPGDDNALATSIRNPGSFIDKGTNCHDWYAAESYEHQDATLWGGESGSKTVWDPCPDGWRVPKETDFYETALTELTEAYAASFDKLGLLVPTGDKAAHNADYGWYAFCWTREPSGTSSKSLLMKTDGYGFSGFSITGDARYEGLSVRCVKE